MGEPTILTQSDIKTSRKYLHISLPLMDSSRFLLAFFLLGVGGQGKFYRTTDDQMMARRSSQIVTVFYSS